MPTPEQRDTIVPLALGGGVLALVGFLPLFGTPGYEAALAAGIVLPPIAAVRSALWAAEDGLERGLARGLLLGSGLVALALSLSVLHGLRSTLCEPWPGLAMIALGGGGGALMGAGWGAVAGATARQLFRLRKRWAVTLALAGPLAGIGLSLARFYTSPMVFAFDPFFGYFAGPLYETVIDPVQSLMRYRMGSAATLLALWCLARALTLAGDPARLLTTLRSQRPLLLGIALGSGVSLLCLSKAQDWGHHSSLGSIRKVLKLSVERGGCEVWFGATTPEQSMRRLARECDDHLGELSAYLRVPRPERVRVLVFADENQKGFLMGAVRTLIAKPWRHEIYITPEGFPHPVLRHELAHVVAGALGRGPFAIAGRYGSLWPDPGRIEGLAEAAAPREDQDLSLREWAAAMQRIGQLPALTSVFQMSFFGHSAATSYTVAGAFSEWLVDEHGAAALGRWYAGETLERATGKPLADLEQNFVAYLRETQLSEQAVHAARARFQTPSVFGRVCPHAVDGAMAEAAVYLGSGNLEPARAALARVLELAPGYFQARLYDARCQLEQGATGSSLAAYRELSQDATLTELERAVAQEKTADLLLALGRLDEARKLYQPLIAASVSEHTQRNLEVKSWAPGASVAARRAIVALLVGEAEARPSWDIAGPQVGFWRAAEPDSGLPAYLLARQALLREDFEEASQLLDEALAKELPLASVRREALRLSLLTSCGLGKKSTAHANEIAQVGADWSPTRRDHVWRFAARCGIELPAKGQAP